MNAPVAQTVFQKVKLAFLAADSQLHLQNYSEMVQRIVRLELKADKVADFHEVFTASKAAIRAFSGCNSLLLYRDETEQNVYYTVSGWDTANDLEAYRHSPLFAENWSQLRELFAARAQAFTLHLEEEVK